MKKPKIKEIYESPAENKGPFVMKQNYDWPEHCCFYNKAGHAVPYPETLQSYILPLIKSAGLGEDGLDFEREYIVTSKKHGLIYRGFVDLLQILADLPIKHFDNCLSFGVHYRIKNKQGCEIFHAYVLYDDGAYGEIEFNVVYHQYRVLKYRYAWRCWEDNSFVYDLDYDVMDAISEVFTVLETAKTRYRPSQVFFDVQNYMRIPKFLRPRGGFRIPLTSGTNGIASRKVWWLVHNISAMCTEYEWKKANSR